MSLKKSAITFLIIAFALSTAAHAQKSAGEHVDDTTTTARVKMALLDNDVSDATDINVETSKGIVQLAGWVNSDEVRNMAGKVAAETEGVKDVSNRLQVQSGSRSAGRALDDTILASKVKLKLAENESTNSTKINVEVRSGVVELSGFVDSYKERDIAVKFVSGIDGVKNVINSIDITR